MNKPEPLSDDEINRILNHPEFATEEEADAAMRALVAEIGRVIARRYEAQIAALAAENRTLRNAAVNADERTERVRAERDRYHDALIARHGGEPVALLAELDAERAKVAALEAERDELVQKLHQFESGGGPLLDGVIHRNLLRKLAEAETERDAAVKAAADFSLALDDNPLYASAQRLRREAEAERDALRADAEIPQAIRTIAKRIAADKFEHCTADPIFEVQHKRLIAGFDTDYTNKIGWFYDGRRVSDEEALELERGFEATGKERSDYFRSGYAEEWEHFASYMTKESAEEVVRSKGEDYRVYVNSGCRNHEWKAIRSFLLQIATNDARAAQEKAE